MDEFAKLIDSRINVKTKGQFMKTVPAVVTIGGTDTATVNILSENTTCELLNMTGSKLSVGDQVQVYSCGKTMYIGASRNIIESGATYTAGDNINISSENVISSYLHAKNVLGVSSQGGGSNIGFNYSINVSRPTVWSGWLVSITLSNLYTGILNETRSLTFFGNGSTLGTASYAYIPEYSAENGSEVYNYSSVTAYMYREGTSSLKLHIDPRYYTVNGGGKHYELAPVIGMATIVCFN